MRRTWTFSESNTQIRVACTAFTPSTLASHDATRKARRLERVGSRRPAVDCSLIAKAGPAPARARRPVHTHHQHPAFNPDLLTPWHGLQRHPRRTQHPATRRPPPKRHAASNKIHRWRHSNPRREEYRQQQRRHSTRRTQQASLGRGVVEEKQVCSRIRRPGVPSHDAAATKGVRPLSSPSVAGAGCRCAAGC